MSYKKTETDTFSLHQWFDLSFSDGYHVKARVDEPYLVSNFYTNEVIYESLTKEMCICLDAAYGASGCEAVVEGFYSVMKAHKKTGHQTNDNLTQRAIVDWVIPHPISAPSTMKTISQLYTQGDKKFELKQHRSVRFFDRRSRSEGKYQTGKVIDRLRAEKPKYPFILEVEDL